MLYTYPIIVGVAIVISLVQNGNLANHVGIKQGTLMNFITCLIGSSLIFILTKESLLTYTHYLEIPFLGYIGGALAVGVVILGSYVINKNSIIASNMLFYVGQFSMGLMIDLLRGTQLSLGKTIGCVFIIIGVLINAGLDSKTTH